MPRASARSGSGPDPSPAFRAGAIAVLGRPNVGKSTLVNALVGQKVSITAPRPQTTRHRILGIVSRPGAQLVLIDTPGLHSSEGRHAINRQLNRTARSSVAEADAVLLLVEAGRWIDADEQAWQLAQASAKPVVLAPNKIDRVKPRQALLPYLAGVTQQRSFAAVVPVSALKRDGLESLTDALVAMLPESGPLYPEDQVTDRSERFLAAELIREQVVRQLHDELPYAAAVVLEDWQETERGALKLGASIYVEREAQKPIVVGAGGSRIKAIGTAARLELTRVLGRPVHLTLWCKVRSDWSDDEAALARFGYAD
jgi:GTP-binding protein Era